MLCMLGPVPTERLVATPGIPSSIRTVAFKRLQRDEHGSQTPPMLRMEKVNLHVVSDSHAAVLQLPPYPRFQIRVLHPLGTSLVDVPSTAER